MNRHLDFLLSVIYDGSSLHPDHLADVRRSGLTDETIRVQKFRSVPPDMIAPLLGFDIPAIRSALLIPFANPMGGWMDHRRVKIFPTLLDHDGHAIKYLQPRASDARLYLPVSTVGAAVGASDPLWLVEGEKKALAVAQLGLPAVGFCGIENWHVARSLALLADFDLLRLRGRTIELVPDGDVATNFDVERGVERFVEALETRGARVRLVRVPVEEVA